MSQTATLYRISNDTFRQLEKSLNRPQFDISYAKNYKTFQGSFMGLEYVLSKGQDISTIEIINEIFNPTKSIGGQEIDNLSFEDEMEFCEDDDIINYLDTTTISKLNNILNSISESEIQAKFDSNELNNNGIYPEIWHNDNLSDLAFNKRHILEDFIELKTIINQATQDNDHIFVFVG